MTKVEFEYEGFDIVAKGKILYGNYVYRLKLYFKEIDELDYPTGRILDEIKDTATERLLEEYYTQEVCYDN